MPANELLEVRGLARELRLPRDWLIAEADAGRIPCLKVGHRRLFNTEAVREAIAKRAAHSLAEEARQ